MLFAPENPAGVSSQERFALDSFVVELHGEVQTGAFYLAGLVASGASDALLAAVAAAVGEATTTGPFGSYPEGPLSAENTEGVIYSVSPELRVALGPRLTAAFEHAHMLVFHPRDAAPQSLQAMLDAGWSTTDIVTLSQITAFLSFQIRVVSGLRTLAASA